MPSSYCRALAGTVGFVLCAAACTGSVASSRRLPASVASDTSVDAGSSPRSASPNIIEHGDRASNAVALTFDADLTPAMERNLDLGIVRSYADVRTVGELRAARVPATIFVTGLWARRYPQLLAEMARDPLFEIENHTWSHPGFRTPCFGLAKASDKGAEVTRAEDELTGATRHRPRYFRFPGGCASPSDVAFVASMGLTLVGWDVVSGDAYLNDPVAVVRNVLRATRGGSIVVFHLDGPPRTPATADAIPRIITTLRERGLRFVRLDELLSSTRP